MKVIKWDQVSLLLCLQREALKSQTEQMNLNQKEGKACKSLGTKNETSQIILVKQTLAEI